jgi:hypothetical protein
MRAGARGSRSANAVSAKPISRSPRIGATSAAVLDVLGPEADTMRPQSPVQYDYSGLYLTQ